MSLGQSASLGQLASRGRERGFTLVELLVVLLILGLILSLAPAALQRLLPSLELRASVRELATVLRESRSRAIHENRETVVAIDVEERVYRVRGKSYPIDRALSLSLATPDTERLDESTGRVRFFPDGTSTGGRVTFEAEKQSYYIVVDWLSGRVEILE